MIEQKLKELRVFAEEIRFETLNIIKSLGFGHIGGCMSMVETMALLYGKYMQVDPKNPRWEERDWFVLSKGHAGPVMYATLGLKGYYPVEDAYTLNQGGSRFPSHTDRNLTPGVDICTGSLGQGMSEAVGVGYGLKVQGLNNRVYVAVGDGELQEGTIWEAAQLAAHYNLDNVICLVDDNKRQLDGFTADVMSHKKGIAVKFEAFGWNTIEVEDGNDLEQVDDALAKAIEMKGAPTCIVLNTIKGKGCSFAEAQGSHHVKPSQAEWDEAMPLVEKKLAEVRAAL